MSGRRHPCELAWSELRPGAWSIDAEAAFAVALGAVQATAGGDGSDDGRARAEAAIDERFRERFGDAACGWRWGYGEASLDGGVVKSWCCSSHSVMAGDPEATARSAAAGIEDWRAHVEALEGAYARLEAPLDDPLALMRALSEVADLSATATKAWSGWYGHACAAMAWYLESRGLAPRHARRIARKHVNGRFESWATPAAAVREAVAWDVAREVAGVPLPDALDAHLRMPVDWSSPPPDVAEALARVPRWGPWPEAHDRYVLRHDRARPDGDARADAMAEALAFVRRRAGEGAPLDPELLAEAHRIAMGQYRPAALRRGNAYAKGGAERYGLPPDFEALLAARLADASGHPLVRASRLYLDVCFLHPFDDGNARAARLAFEHVLHATRHAVAHVAPVFSVPRVAGDPASAWSLVRVVARLATVPR